MPPTRRSPASPSLPGDDVRRRRGHRARRRRRVGVKYGAARGAALTGLWGSLVHPSGFGTPRRQFKSGQSHLPWSCSPRSTRSGCGSGSRPLTADPSPIASFGRSPSRGHRSRGKKAHRHFRCESVAGSRGPCSSHRRVSLQPVIPKAGPCESALEEAGRSTHVHRDRGRSALGRGAPRARGRSHRINAAGRAPDPPGRRRDTRSRPGRKSGSSTLPTAQHRVRT